MKAKRITILSLLVHRCLIVSCMRWRCTYLSPQPRKRQWSKKLPPLKKRP